MSALGSVLAGATSARVFRAIAVIIAIAAAVDPLVTSNRTSRPDVAVVALDPSRDSALAARVGRTLAGGFTVTAAPFAAAGATLFVGDAVPASAPGSGGRPFAVVPDHRRPSTAIEAIRVPTSAPLDVAVPVLVDAHAIGLANGRMELTLRLDGVVVDRVTQGVNRDDWRGPVHLAFTPTTTGVAVLQVVATVSGPAGRGDSSVADAAVDVRDHRWSVLFDDSRPSWLSTFVRRAIEGDDRFVVTSRVVTSRNISTDAGNPPGALDNETLLDSYDAVVIGAPDGLTDRDVTGLDRYLRRRGGSVVFLLDQQAPGPWQRLTDAGKWLGNGDGRLQLVGRTPRDSSLRGSEFTWPVALPHGAEALAYATSGPSDTVTRRPVIWQSPVGAGRLIVSGALDAWRYRDPALSHFDLFWRGTIADAASAAAEPVALRLSAHVVVPGDPLTITVGVRDAELRPLPARTSVSATIASAAGDRVTPIRLWPGGTIGELTTKIRAPMIPGRYRITVTADGNRSETWLAVSAIARHPVPDNRQLLAGWVTAQGGSALAESGLGALPAALRSAIPATARRERWHPLRSAWWLLPFAFALSGEWWSRRRRGLP